MSEQELIDGFIAAQETGLWEEFFAWCRERGFRFADDPFNWQLDGGSITVTPGDSWIVYGNSGSTFAPVNVPWSYTTCTSNAA